MFTSRESIFRLGLAVFTFALVILSWGYNYKVSEFQVQGPGNRQVNTVLPFSSGSWGKGLYTANGSIERSWFGPTSFRFIPDDYLKELTINGQVIDLSGIPDTLRKNINTGFQINLKDNLVLGTNQVEIVFEDFGGNIAIDIKSGKSDVQFSLLAIAWVALGICIFFMVTQKVGGSKLRATLYLLILLGSMIKIWYIFTYNPVDHIWSDPARHWEQGTDLLRKDLMALTDPIGYQVYVAVIAKLTLKIPELVAFYASFLALFGAWIWYRFLRELQTDKTLALCAWALFSLIPSWTAIYSYFMQETLFIPLLGAALWGTWRCRRKADIASFSLMIFLWILAGLTRGIAIPLAAVVCTWLWIVQDLKWKKAVFSSLILVAIMGPLTYRAYQIVHHFAPHGMGHLNVIYAQSGKKTININVKNVGRWGFGSPSTGAKPFEPFSDWTTQRRGTVRVSIDMKKGMHDWKLASKAQHMGFKDYLWITKENFYFLFFASSWPDNNAERFLDRVSIWTRYLWAPLLAVLLIGIAVHFRKFKGQWMLPAVLGTWFIVQCLIPIAINEGRYRKPFEGIAIAQFVLWMAVIRGQTRPGAPSTPLSEYLSVSRAYFDKKRHQWLPEKKQPE